MERILFQNIHKNRKYKSHPFYIASLFSIVSSLFIIFFLHCDFETNDDYGMSTILYGTYGNYNSHLVFINIIIGKFLKILLSIFPVVPWYTVFQILLIIVSFAALFYILLKNSENQLAGAYLLIGLLFLFFQMECLVQMQFSKTAAIASIAGLVLLFEAADNNNQREMAAGTLLVFLGSMVRYSTFEMTLVIFFIVGIKKTIVSIKHKNLRIIKLYLLFFGIAIIGSFLLNQFDKWQYNKNPDWKAYREINLLRAELLDFGFPDYKENQELYSSLGITPEDITMYQNWTFADTEIFSKENLELLCAAKEGHVVRMHTFTEFLRNWRNIFFQYRFFIGCLIIFLIWLFSNRNEPLLVILGMLTIIAIELFLYYKGRYLLRRIDFGIITAAAVVTAWNIKWTKLNPNRNMTAIILGSLLLNILPGIQFQVNAGTNEVNEARELYQLLNSDSEHLYLNSIWFLDQKWAAAYPFLVTPPQGIMNNSYTTGGWGYGMPVTNQVFQNYGITNPLGKEIVDNPSVYFIDNNAIEEKAAYIRRHYNQYAYPSLVKYINGNSVYRFVTHEPEVNESNAMPKGSDIHCSVTTDTTEDGKLAINGYAYQNNTDSFQQEVYISLENIETKETIYYATCQIENEEHDDPMNGKYSGFQLNLMLENADDYHVTVYLKTENGMYKI